MKKTFNQNRPWHPSMLLRLGSIPKVFASAKATLFLILSLGMYVCANGQVFTTTLSGPNEAPPNASSGVGSATVTINSSANTMRVQSTFSGLTGTTTSAHIHAPTAIAGTGAAGVATTTPTFPGFPAGVTAGTYDMTFDMTLASSYNPSYVTANGGTPASAFAALQAAMAAGKAYFNLHSSAFPGGEIRGFLQGCSQVAYAYNNVNNHLISFNLSAPGTILTDVALTGLSAGEFLTGIDYRPADGQLYSVTVTPANTGRVVRINRTTGAVTQVGATSLSVSINAYYGIDFNPVPDRIRLIGTDGTNRRLNPNDGTLAATDTPPAYVTGDPNFGQTIAITECAYTNSVAGATATTLYAIDYNQDLLVRIGGVNGTPSPNTGGASTIGSIGFAAAFQGGFDIEPTTNNAYAVLTPSGGGVAGLYTINLSTGAATLIGAIGGAPASIDGFTIVPCTPPPVICYAYNRSLNRLISFRNTAPGTLLSNVALTGLNTDENLTGFDYRPADGFFYAVATNSSNVARVVTINRTTGSVASVGTASLTISSTTRYGLDFNPVPDRIRLIGGDATNRRLNPNDGTLSATDISLAYATGDPNFGTPVAVTQAAYTNSVAGATVTTLYGIDSSLNNLVRVGGVNGSPSPNGGVTTTIGPLGVMTANGAGGFDIEPVNNNAYAALRVNGVSALYSINLSTGAATLLGTIGDGVSLIDGLSIIPFTPPVCVAPATRIYVDANVATSGSGSSWGCAMKELSAAIIMANATPAIKSIWVADGVYTPTTGTDRNVVMAITRADLRILGGFAGGEANASDANPALNPAIISGDLGVQNDMSDNSYRLMNIGGRATEPNGLVIDGFIFEKGNANAPGDGDKSVGPAILSYAVASGTPVTISRSIFRDNFGTASGAIFLINSNFSFDGCRFANNSTNGSGGAVLAYQCDQAFTNCVFALNTAVNGGGAFYGNYGTASFSKTVFSANSAGTGGAVYQNRYNSTVANGVFNANTSISGGGAMFIHNASNSDVKNSTFFKNTAATSGGAIVLVEANSAINAGNNIFYKNTANGLATGTGSDITNFTGGANVYANNILQQGTAVPADNGTTRRNNLRGADPLFVNEANVLGGDGVWGTADDGLELTNTSPAKNTGDNALAPAGTDITNSPRIACTTVDMGAYENQNCCATNLLGTSVTGSLTFGGGGTNYFNSSNGFVPAGCGNSGTGNTTVTISDPNAEFCFADGANNDVANFTNNTLTITDIASTASGASAFTMTFQLAPGATGAVSETSDNFPNGGMSFSLVGNLLTLTMPGFSGTGSYSASYSFTGCGTNAEPAIARIAATNSISKEGNDANGVSTSPYPSVVTLAKEVVPAGTGAVVNPFSNDLQIRYMGTEKAGISVSSASGKTMSLIGNIKSGITHVDASSWSRGLYEVVITTASGKRINFKVVKM